MNANISVIEKYKRVARIRCPKKILNGPCGGVRGEGGCELGDRDCVWIIIFKKFEKDGRLEDLRVVWE